MKEPKHKAVFIDWYGTLSTSRFWQHWETERPNDAALIKHHFFDSDKDLIWSWMRGELTAEDIARLLEQRTGIAEHELLRGLQESSQQQALIDENVLDLIDNVRNTGARVTVATDNMDTFPRWTVPALRLDEHFDNILDSHSLKILKLDKDENDRPAFFNDYLLKHGITPEETVIFDDNAHRLQPFGLDCIQVSPKQPLTARLSEYLQTNKNDKEL